MEARSTIPGVLGHLRIPSEESPNGGDRHEGLISVVVESPHDMIRPLRLYLSTLPIFAARDIGSVRDRMNELTLTITRAAMGEHVYLLVACELDGRRGIYAGNVFNRSKYLRALTRMGANLSQSPFLWLTPEGSFKPRDGEPFRPSFILLGEGSADGDALRLRDGQLLFRIASRRLGMLATEELGLLAGALQGLEAIATDDPWQALANVRT